MLTDHDPRSFIGVSDYAMLMLLCDCAQSDVIAQHRVHSLADSLNMPQQTSGR